MFNSAFNYIPFVDESALTVRRKGKVIKGETEQAISQARRERQAQKNAAKASRRARRGK